MDCIQGGSVQTGSLRNFTLRMCDVDPQGVRLRRIIQISPVLPAPHNRFQKINPRHHWEKVDLLPATSPHHWLRMHRSPHSEKATYIRRPHRQNEQRPPPEDPNARRITNYEQRKEGSQEDLANLAKRRPQTLQYHYSKLDLGRSRRGEMGPGDR